MARPKLHNHCTIKGCEREHYAKGYCRMHYQRYVVKKVPRFTMFSACHGKPVHEGPQHEFGKQYCDKCKEPCLWRYI